MFGCPLASEWNVKNVTSKNFSEPQINAYIIQNWCQNDDENLISLLYKNVFVSDFNKNETYSPVTDFLKNTATGHVIGCGLQ